MADLKITELVKTINGCLPEGTKSIKVNQLHKWLKANGYINNKKDKNGKTYKHITTEGRKFGLKKVTKEYGDITFVFAKKAQKYLLENINDISAQINQDKI